MQFFENLSYLPSQIYFFFFRALQPPSQMKVFLTAIVSDSFKEYLTGPDRREVV